MASPVSGSLSQSSIQALELTLKGVKNSSCMCKVRSKVLHNFLNIKISSAFRPCLRHHFPLSSPTGYLILICGWRDARAVCVIRSCQVILRTPVYFRGVDSSSNLFLDYRFIYRPGKHFGRAVCIFGPRFRS